MEWKSWELWDPGCLCIAHTLQWMITCGRLFVLTLCLHQSPYTLERMSHNVLRAIWGPFKEGHTIKIGGNSKKAGKPMKSRPRGLRSLGSYTCLNGRHSQFGHATRFRLSSQTRTNRCPGITANTLASIYSGEKKDPFHPVEMEVTNKPLV